MPSTTSPSTGTTSPVLTTMMSPGRSFSSGVSTSTPSRHSQTNRGCLPKALSSFCDARRRALGDELAADAEAPAEHGAREDLARQQADDHDDRVEHVDAEPALLQRSRAPRKLGIAE